MSESVDPSEFHDRVISGVDEYETITLTASDGAELEDVELHSVSKHELARAIELMPDEVFENIEAEDEDISAEEAEEIAQQRGGAPITSDMYDAFENLCKQSLRHDGLSQTQVDLIIDEFSFNVVFELGSQILEFSIEESGAIKDFREQS